MKMKNYTSIFLGFDYNLVTIKVIDEKVPSDLKYVESILSIDLEIYLLTSFWLELISSEGNEYITIIKSHSSKM